MSHSLPLLYPYLVHTHTHTIIEPFGVKAGQQVTITVINLNSNIPTFVVSEDVIQAATPGLVSLAESIASSQDFSNKIAAFVGVASTPAVPKPTPDSPPAATPTGQTADSSTSPPSSSATVSQMPTPGAVGFIFTTPAPVPSGSNNPHVVGPALQSFLVGLIFVGAYLV